ncbi:unnamed protein product [Lymnaea stagnalis]|uniref:Macro domain-containing protein n=1 Tax=Lymnaea stagnalis TaxID=6523 RepID=A0AAV2H3H5_LYMST
MENFDLMESTEKTIDSDYDVEVFRVKKQHFQAAKKYLVCLNLAKYSLEKGDEFEITLNKTSDRSIISQIKEFTAVEIPISNYEWSLSAMNIVSENYLNVHFISSRSTLLLYGLKREVSSAKIDLLAQLGIPDEIDQEMTDGTAKSFGRKAPCGQSSQERDSNITQTKSYTLNDKRINSYDGNVSSPVESISVDSISEESIFIDSISVDSIPVESIFIDGISVDSTPVESIFIDSISVDSSSVESNPVESSTPVESPTPIESRENVERISVKTALSHRRNKETSNTSELELLHVLKQTRAQFYTGSKTNLKVYARKENITKLDTDIIVNGTNRHLKHDDGIAKAIASAAGRSLVNECNSHITTYGPLDVTDVFVSNGGLLGAKFVMHAVGPKWKAYADKHQCLTDLRRTVVRCLVEASRKQQASIALPSISADIFKYPKNYVLNATWRPSKVLMPLLII